jgi:hypothetical protein
MFAHDQVLVRNASSHAFSFSSTLQNVYQVFACFCRPVIASGNELGVPLCVGLFRFDRCFRGEGERRVLIWNNLVMHVNCGPFVYRSSSEFSRAFLAAWSVFIAEYELGN